MSEKITIDQLRIPLNVTQGHSLRQENGSFTFAQDSKVNLPCYVGCVAGYTAGGTSTAGCYTSKFPLASGAPINVNFSVFYHQYYPLAPGGLPQGSGVSSDEAGYAVGHNLNPSPLFGTACYIRKFNFVSEGEACGVGTYCGVPYVKCVGSATAKTPGYAYSYGGVRSPGANNPIYFISCIYKLQYAGDQYFNSVGDMQTNRTDGGCYNSLDDGYQLGGRGTPAQFPGHPIQYNDTLEKIPFASDNCGVCVGSLSLSFPTALFEQKATLSGPAGGYALTWGEPYVPSPGYTSCASIFGFTFSSGSSSIVQTGILNGSGRTACRGAGISSETCAFYARFLGPAIGSIYGFPFASHGDATIVGCYQPNARAGCASFGWQV